MAQAPEIRQPWSFDPAIAWKLLNADKFNDALKMWQGVGPGHLPDDANIYVMDLPFYRNHKLYCLTGTVDGELRHCFMLRGMITRQLNGTSPAIHEVNAYDPINITKENVVNYLRFFCSFVHGDFGPFLPIENVEQFEIPENLDAKDRVQADILLAHLRTNVEPIEQIEQTTNGPLFASFVYFGDVVYKCEMKVHATGMIEMQNDEPVATDIPKGMIATAPKLCSIDDLLIEPINEKYTIDGSVQIADQSYEPEQSSITYSSQGNSTNQTSATSNTNFTNDRDITRYFVSVLVKYALENDPNYDVLTDFNKVANKRNVINDFAKYVYKNGPVVIIESDIPYIEEMLADIVVSNSNQKKRLIKRFSRLDTAYQEQDAPTIMIMSADDLTSVNQGYGTVNLERLAFDISMSKHPVFIGTNNQAGLPDALVKVTEYTVTIPKINTNIFKILFDNILNGNLPRGWKNRNTQWISYLTPHDFHQPYKAGLSGAKAYRYLQNRVKERLKSFETSNSPNLQDLHGMAEAKQMAEDLISDIQGALKGQLPWSAVDRGILLAGPPGTGKTTLAKAIAKACSVRFISVSAAKWQSSGAMSEHLRAMRASFAEARRYAPSILFIDEVDSFSDRENHVGHNATYNTEIVNALLAEIQGFDDQKPVFVIGATNFPHKVDPALRRAGRLDKLVYIPHPNTEALSSIYNYYLSKKELVGKTAGDIDTKFLGGMSFGVTGADVESYVRGAVRRARKALAPLSQQHLIDEITGKSRSSDSSTRLNAEEMHHVAVHESGHAILQLLSGHAPIAYVSIVPRENGSLGFVANMPSGNKMLTRKHYLEHLQVVLGGRAAEEIVYGKDNVAGGAGGESKHSDLAIATKLATNLVCSLGMGKTSTLIWGNTPNEDQQDEIEKLLQEAYSTALAKLEAHRKSLDALSKALVEKQELMGDEVKAIINLN